MGLEVRRASYTFRLCDLVYVTKSGRMEDLNWDKVDYLSTTTLRSIHNMRNKILRMSHENGIEANEVANRIEGKVHYNVFEFNTTPLTWELCLKITQAMIDIFGYVGL